MSNNQHKLKTFTQILLHHMSWAKYRRLVTTYVLDQKRDFNLKFKLKDSSFHGHDESLSVNI